MKPIIFSTPMVQAILDGKKTQTRRVIKIDDAPENWKISIAGTSIVRTEPYDVKLPRYAAGDILWVRETWSKDENGEYVYRANYGTTEDDSFPPSMFKWKPSIHMPREAARIFLEVKNVRVERIKEISNEDILAEGINDLGSYGANYDYFANEIWDSINGKKYPWKNNPWVWVYEFGRIDNYGKN